MKKFIKILLCIGLLLQNFVFIPSVRANTFDGIAFAGVSIRQGNTMLQKEGDVYVAPGYDNIILYYNLTGYNQGSSYGNVPYIRVDSAPSDYECNSGPYYSGYYTQCRPSFQNEIQTYTVKICDDYECQEPYDTYEFSIRYDKYDEVNDDRFFYTEVNQGGHAVESVEHVYTLNNRQSTVFSIGGKNLDPTANYTINCGYNNEGDAVYTGAELMAGASYTCDVSKYSSVYPIARIGGLTITLEDGDNEYYEYSNFNLVEDNTLPSYEAVLKYTNYPDIPLKKFTDNYGSDYHYLVRSKYANADNTLSYAINGTNFANQEYNIDLKILKDNNVVYTRDVKVNGSLLNNGYNLEFSDFDLGTVTNTKYTMQITLDYVTTQTVIEYIYPDKDITITSVKQNGVELQKQNGVYIAPDISYIVLSIDVEDYDPQTDEYYINVSNEEGINISFEYMENREYNIPPNFENETEDLTIALCDNWSCNNLYTFENIKVKLEHFTELKNQKIFFYDVTQGNNTITPDSNGNFYFNNRQDVKVKVRGTDLIDDQLYTITAGSYGSGVRVTGSELEKGIEITHHTNGDGYYNVDFYMGEIDLDVYYFDGENYRLNGEDYVYFRYAFIDGEYTNEYESTLKYANYPDEEVAETEYDYNNSYIINSHYHDADNPLAFYVKGSGYEDEDYSVDLWVTEEYEGTEVYRTHSTANGTDINNGITAVLSNYAMEKITSLNEGNISLYGMPSYEVCISIDEVTTCSRAQYNSIGRHVGLYPEIFFENGKKNLAAFMGFGNSGMYETNNDVFNKYSKIYINYLGNDFDDEDEYDYVLEYGYYYETDDDFNVTYPATLKTGKVAGNILNNVGLFFELGNNSNYDDPTYRLIIKKGDEIITFSSPVISLTEKATLGSVVLSSRNRSLYLKTSDYSYIATRSMPIDIEISGIGFADDEEYEFDFCYTPIYGEYDYGDETCDALTLLGSDLNAGTASIDFDEEIDENAEYYSFYVIGSGSTYFGQGGFSLSFVDNSELFPNMTRYIIDDASEIIKNIKKNTTVAEFTEKLGIAEGDKIKIYDKTGQTEITDKVGTGMLGVVQNAYDQNIINVDIAVKGDTTGDGNISVTDLVKVKRHLADIEQLQGIYEVAGNVTETGTIQINDLIQMCQDVTGIMEIQ